MNRLFAKLVTRTWWVPCVALVGCIDPIDASRPNAATEIPEPCAAELEFFRTAIYEPILEVECIGCHNASGPARQTRMILSPITDDQSLLNNYRSTARVSVTTLGDVPLVLVRPSGAHPDGHTGGTLVARGSFDYKVLAGFASMAGTNACDVPAGLSCDAPQPGPRRLRRLTHPEYENTIRDLLGATVDASGFAADPVVEGFANNADELEVSALLASQYDDTARMVAHDVLATSPTRVHSCLSTLPASSGCVDLVIAEFGERSFRRPLSDEEQSSYRALYETLSASSLDGTTVMEMLLAAFLESPHFLYRPELGSVGSDLASLDAYEVASELSYLIVGTMPDATLYAKAVDGSLLDDTVLEAEARRLLALPEARPTVVGFFMQWLGLERIMTVPKDSVTYPEITPAMRASMRAEAEAFIEHVVFEGDGTLESLLTATFSFVDDGLAAHYGVTPTGDPDANGLRRVEYDDDVHAGLLTLGATMTVHARSNDSSPVQRGRLVRERLMCQPLPPPPPNIMAVPPAVDPSVSTRERYMTHSSVEPCRSCHRLMDPIGFAFEQLDGSGRLREGSLDTSGYIIGGGSLTGDFATEAELISTLSESSEVVECFAREWFRYAYGLVEDAELECLLREQAQAFATSSGRVDDLLVSLVLGPHFRKRRLESATTDPGTDPGSDPGTGETMDGGVSTPDSGSGSGSSPMTSANVSVDESVQSEWATGFCHEVAVENTGSSTVSWQVVLPISSSKRVTNNWNSTMTRTGDLLVFHGVEWNASLSAGASAEFGYCVDN